MDEKSHSGESKGTKSAVIGLKLVLQELELKELKSMSSFWLKYVIFFSYGPRQWEEREMTEMRLMSL